MHGDSSTVTQTLQAYPSRYLTVVDGYNLGAEISFQSELTLDDIYALSSTAHLVDITVTHSTDTGFRIAPDSATGSAGNMLHFDCIVTLMSTLGDVADVVILVETTSDDRVAATYFLPLVRLDPKRRYSLIEINQDNPQARYGEQSTAAFTHGTHITIPTGLQRPIEDLKPGDEILTRTNGAQPLRWIGVTTVRAIGEFAPVLIRQGVMNNTRDLLLSPNHRLFIYRRNSEDLGIGRHEVLVHAKHLVNGTTITFQPGGFIDYYHLLFEDHQIIYAEGISAETLRVTPRNRHALPREACKMAKIPPQGHAKRYYDNYELDTDTLSSMDVLKLLAKTRPK